MLLCYDEPPKQNLAPTTYTATTCFKRRSLAGIEKFLASIFKSLRSGWQYKTRRKFRENLKQWEDLFICPDGIICLNNRSCACQFLIISVQVTSGLPRWDHSTNRRSGGMNLALIYCQHLQKLYSMSREIPQCGYHGHIPTDRGNVCIKTIVVCSCKITSFFKPSENC